MLLIAVILMSVATLATLVALCISKRGGKVFFALKTLLYICLICLGVSIASYKNNFSGFTLLLILSVVPMFLSLISLNENQPENEENYQNNQENYIKNAKKSAFFEKMAQILPKTAFMLSSLCVAISALYIGKETPFGILLGIAFACAMAFLDFIIKKRRFSFFDFCLKFMLFLGAGLALGAVIPVLLYSFTLPNILFAIGLIVYASYFILENYFSVNYVNIAYTIGMAMIFASILL